MTTLLQSFVAGIGFAAGVMFVSVLVYCVYFLLEYRRWDGD